MKRRSFAGEVGRGVGQKRRPSTNPHKPMKSSYTFYSRSSQENSGGEHRAVRDRSFCHANWKGRRSSNTRDANPADRICERLADFAVGRALLHLVVLARSRRHLRWHLRCIAREFSPN